MAWHKATTTTQLTDRQVVGVEVNGVEVAVYRLDDGYYATNNICTHQRAFMSDGYIENDCIECPLHQAIFDIKTGAALEGPAKGPLASYPTRVDGDDILVELP